MASERQINFAKRLITQLGGNVEDYKLPSSLPGHYGSDLSLFIGDMTNDNLTSSGDWNKIVDSLLAPVESTKTEDLEIDDFKAAGLKLLKPDIEAIDDYALRDFVNRSFLEIVPAYFWTVAASTTGEYHPLSSVGKGGLVNHTKSAVTIARAMFTINRFTTLEQDQIIAALLLHDCAKTGLPGYQSKYTVHEHPMLVRILLKDAVLPTELQVVEPIFDLIESHMGQWSSSNRSDIVLPEPETELQKYVHLCDYLSSRRYLEIDFSRITL